MSKWIVTHRKAIAAVVGQALTFSLLRYGASNQYVEIAVALAAAAGVYAVPNDPAPPKP